MKAERRHALQQNALATKIVQLPNIGRIWLRRAVIAVVAIIVIALVVLMRLNDAATRRAESQQFLAQALDDGQKLRMRPPPSPNLPLDESYIRTMQETYMDAQLNLDQVQERIHDPAMLAQALRVRGDINLFMATFPTLSAASTQPTVPFSLTSAQAYSAAADAYNKLLQQYPDQHMNVLAARLGLASLAEDRSDWKAARDQYQIVVDDPTSPMVYVEQAKAKIATLDKPQSSPFIAQKEIAPLINPSEIKPPAQNPATAPTSAPATRMATTATTHPH